MGVFGTVCALCGLPLQHDHYVPTSGGMLQIYRGSDPHPERAFAPDQAYVRFGAEHAWLRSAVWLRAYGSKPSVIHGRMEDGVFIEAETGNENLVMDDFDAEHPILHAACWRILGQQHETKDVPRTRGSHAYAFIDAYHGQLFAFPEFIADGKAWMLVDPELTTPDGARSRDRIETLIEEGRALAFRRSAFRARRCVQDVLRIDDDWRGGTELRDNNGRNFMTRQRAIPSDLDVSGYPAMIWYIKPYPPDAFGLPAPDVLADIEAFEVAFKADIEREGAAILVAVLIGKGRAQYVAYAQDEVSTMARIERLPGRNSPEAAWAENSVDPHWRDLFDKLPPPA
ncbi:MAG: DUF695 domain-containing protein [Deltaproteobacteria bacterium]|nr:DUF695 domain-containing protein [Deltaproteobacteria bacterium]